MSDEFFGPPTDFPEDVPAETQADGAVTEDNTGEQVADKAGNSAWFDSNYPGQIQNTAGNPTQDAYGLNILSAAETKDLTRNINPAFINSLVDPNTPTAAAGNNAVNTSAAAPVSVYVDPNGVAFNPVTGVSYPVDSQGRQLLPENVALTSEQKLRINLFNQTPANLSPTAVSDPEIGPRTEYRQTVADAARLNAQSETPNPFLTQIDKAGAEIVKGQAGIATANETIQSAQQKIVTSESIIAQNNTELANPDTTAERRAVLEANNAAQTQNIFDQTQSVTENQAYIANTQDTIQFNEATINENAAVYRDSTGPSNTTVVPINVDPNVTVAETATATANIVANPITTAVPVNANTAGLANVVATTVGVTTTNTTAAQDSAIQTQVGRQLAQQQAVNAAQKKIVNNGDWRVRLSLAKGANYLYNVDDPGILAPLKATGGVIFPYTPQIEMSYKADYESYALTHSNYKGYFYKSSSVDAVNMSATFTAQDSAEADYLLAVIHFFRSVTKMFYGQDPQRGAPPPLVYLTGLGQYQFAGHPCVVTSFNYNLPRDIDYIRARSTNINGTNLLTRRNRQDLPTNPISGAVARLQSLFSGQGISYGAERNRPQPPTLGQNQPTYVPTKLDISLSLLPVQSRSQITNQFSVADYASGALLKGGFW